MDIIITWPKSRDLESYLVELGKAETANLLINFRVPSRPDAEAGDRCYVVWNGYIRGWNTILDVAERSDVIDPISGELMKPGIFVVRKPKWHWCGDKDSPAVICNSLYCTDGMTAMKGFQGYRYYRY